MHFVSFVINVLAWTFMGIGLGFFLHKGTGRSKTLSVFIGSMFSLIGGIFSSMSHGMFPEIGIDFFNLSAAFLFGTAALYIFAPNTRESIAGAVAEVYNQTKILISELRGERTTKSPYFNSQFWKNITSTLP